MYIEYTTPQREAYFTITKFMMKRVEYRPTWLIRTSDWKKVPGTEAKNGYHALSYCWEQSGEKYQKEDGEYDIIDNGQHRIIHVNTRFHLRAPLTSFRVPTEEVLEVEEVTYDELLQQICKDSKVDYLWYDKICIDQTNKAEKQREVKQMHLIYSNAHWTIAIVPEIYIKDPKDFGIRTFYSCKAKDTAISQMTKSLWWQRSWTLEEVMMATGILVVGRNAFFYTFAKTKQGLSNNNYDILADNLLEFHKKERKSINQVLRQAHFRTSTKDHDRIFALANILHDTVSIKVDYSIDFLTLMNDFYRQLAEYDLSIMCFGSNLYTDGSPRSVTTMASYNLPSWTGVRGLHPNLAIVDIVLDHNGNKYSIDKNMRLHIRCRNYTIRPIKYSDYDYSVYDDEKRAKRGDRNLFKKITSMDHFGGDEIAAIDWSIFRMGGRIGLCPTHYWKRDHNTGFPSPISPLSLTEDCDECIILDVIYVIQSEWDIISEKVNEYNYYYLSPVVKKSTNGSYMVIGTILLDRVFGLRSKRPRKVVDKTFSKLNCQVNDFYIE